MWEFVYFNEEWNNDICPVHSIKLNEDKICPKCLEEKNNKYESSDRKFQGVHNTGKRRGIKIGKVVQKDFEIKRS
jgi:hypothetical protein